MIARLTGPLVALVLLAGAPAAQAAPKPLGRECQPRDGVRFCPGTIADRVPSFDGVPLDVDVTLPGTGEGPWPLIIEFHGYSGQKRGFDDGPPHEGPKRLAQRGFAVVHFTARGFHGSCGTPESRAAAPEACARGWLHLDDVRFEMRDGQHLAGLLVDEGIAEPRRIGAWADSYGGAPSLALAILRDRIVLPDGSYAPWRSPKGVALELAAAAPYQTWSDLINALMPNGRSLDFTVPRLDESFGPPGVLKLSFTAGLYASGQISTSTGRPIGYYAPPGVDPGADLSTWLPRLQAGEPYAGDPTVEALAREIRAHHSPLWLDMSRTPAPLLLSTGSTDDLFPPLEMLRMRNLIQERHPRAVVALHMADFGHQRGNNRPSTFARRNDRILDWFSFWLKGSGGRPSLDIEAYTQACPLEAVPLGPFRAPTWRTLHPGEVRGTFDGTQSVVSGADDPAVASTIDPVRAGQNPCGTTSAADQGPGVATYRLPAAPTAGWTLLGSPTVVARLDATGAYPQVAARLWDVGPDGTQVLIARGALRPRGGGRREPLQLSANGWRFAAGHVPKLELLAADAPFLRTSNGTHQVAISELELRLPVREAPGTAPGVGAPSAVPLPEGARAAPDLPPAIQTSRPARIVPLRVRVTVRCPARERVLAVTGPRIRTVTVRDSRGRVVARDSRAPHRLRVRRAGALSVEVRLADRRTLRRSVRTVPRC